MAEKQIPIMKIDEAKHIVFGVVLQPEIPDLQGDIISKEEIEKCAHDYMINSRETGFRHKAKLDAAIVESYITKGEYWICDQEVKNGSWVIAMKVFDMNVWAMVMSGEINSFSIGGFAESAPIDNSAIEDKGGGQ
jgi:hypothetical protein